MPSVCFYFQVHQPWRLRRYSYFQSARDHDYFDEQKNRAVMEKVAEKCYLPTNAKILDLINRFQGRFKVAYSITGTAIEQMRLYSPRSLQSFIELSKTGCVEFLAETFYHSLAAVFDESEFRFQVGQHGALIKEFFGQIPRVFRNTELIYSDEVGRNVASMGYDAVIAEGADDILGWRSPNFVYDVPGQKIKLLLKNYRLSDDIAFRFSNRSWECYPLTADTFAKWVHAVSGNGETVNLFMDYETFGEHQWASTGIFEFLDHLPEKVLAHSEWNFRTPSEVVASYPARGEMPFRRLTSWADVDRDLTAWNGNRMQASALRKIYELGTQVLASGDAQIIESWRRLLTSDHFYYMCTKWFADGDVHAYFSPYESPYEAFITYMNVVRDLSTRVQGDSRELRRALTVGN